MGEVVGFVDTAGGRVALGAARAAVSELIHGAYSRVHNNDIDEFGRELEMLSRLVWAAQVRYTDEVDQRGLAAARSCTSTGALLQQSLLISAADAANRVRAARHTQPQDLPSGGSTPPVLPVVGDAVDAGRINADHTRTLVQTLQRLPATLDPAVRAAAEHTLVHAAISFDPDQFRKIAHRLQETIDPDGQLGTDPASKMELHIGFRNAATGLTSITGRLDDLGAETLRKAIDGLAAPHPTVDGITDQRPAALRRAQALVEVLNRSLTHTLVPEQGGQRPQVTVTLDWELIRDAVGTATLDNGETLTPAVARRILCDAEIIPAVLGGHSEVLDLGRSARTFNRATRRAIALRDKGCAFPGCNRPPDWCDGHHVKWFTRDCGQTSYTNGCLLCAHHHSIIHRGEWTIAFAADGVPEFIPPKWLDPYQKPRRNTLHHFDPG